jgi:predicted Rossmann-fold nucleotide-binding protein
MLAFSSQAYVYFPGGFGTLDEFFEIINLIQSKRVDPNIAVVLVGKDYWETLLLWFDKYLYEAYGFIKEEDVFSYILVDTAEDAFKVIKKKTKGLKLKRKF